MIGRIRALWHRVPTPWRRSVRGALRWCASLGRGGGAVAASVESAGYDVVCLPVIDWSFRIQRPQQLLRRFAAAGHRVFYVATRFHGLGRAPVVVPIEERVFGVGLRGPLTLDLYTETLSAPVADRLCAGLAQLGEAADLREVVCLVQHPFWRPVAARARERWGWRLVYDCLDEHVGFGDTAPALPEEEAALVAVSDLVVASSELLGQRMRAEGAQPVLVPNGVDFAHFNRPAQRPGEMAGLGGPIIGYFGAISGWFDVAAVRAAATTRPAWSFVLLGSTVGADVSTLRSSRNVHLLGERSYEELPGFLHAFDVALIPFLRTPLTEATDPVKFYEYSSAGKPVVAPALPALERFAGLLYRYGEPRDLVPAIERALAEDDTSRRAARIDAMRRETWQERFVLLAEAIRRTAPEVAIIVISHRHPDKLRLCLESIRCATLYPNYRLIVVDNGSGPEVRRCLEEERERRGPRVELVFNEDNRGFAAAVNQGIGQAGDAEILVVLNNDTVVTRGWLGGLLAHLEQPEVAMVGPVTNQVGNEARIPTRYRNLEEMERFARRQARRHSGARREMRVLAMFCVAFRRSLVERIGSLDERFRVGMFEDDDFAERIRRTGGKLVCAEDVFVHHWGRASFSQMEAGSYRRLFEENRFLFEEKWGELWVPHRHRS